MSAHQGASRSLRPSKRQLERIEIARLPGLEEIEVAASHDSLTVALRMSFTDRNDGEARRFFHPHSVPIREYADADAATLAQVIREGIRRAYEHEIDESISVDCKRVFDPHGSERQ